MKLFPLVFAVLLAWWTLLANCALAGSATWNLSPTSGDWNTAANWTPNTVPNDPADIATFDASNITSIFVRNNTGDDISVAETVFNPGAGAYTIYVMYPTTFSFYGAGITNNSKVAQTFETANVEAEIHFYDSATAGDDTVLIQAHTRSFEFTSQILFSDTSSAGSATIFNEGNEESGGGTRFYDSATAANATVFNRAGFYGGATYFYNSSHAGSATFVCDAGIGWPNAMYFYDDSSGDNATIIASGSPSTRYLGRSVAFSGSATAGNASFIINGGTNGGPGATLSFGDGSLGGTAQVKLSGDGTLDLTAHDPGTVSIGSLAGDGLVLLGTTNLTVGTNNFKTEFSGKIEDNAGPTGASLTKTGSGNLALSGANAYDGGTFVDKGTLFVNNVTGSGTGTGTVQVNSGVLGGNGTIGGSVRIGDTVPGPARFMPGRNERNPGVLTIANTLTFVSDGSYLWLLNSARRIASSVTTNGATIGSISFFTPSDLQPGSLSPGTVFTVINNTSPNAIFQTFKNLPDGGTITVGRNTFQANYEGGDGNDLTLTVQ